MRRGLLLSVAFHVALGVLAAVGLSRIDRPLPTENAITVDIVTAENVAAPPAAAPQAAAAPLPERQAASPTPPAPPAPPRPEPPKPEPPKPEPPKPEPPKPEPPKPEPPKPPPPPPPPEPAPTKVVEKEPEPKKVPPPPKPPERRKAEPKPEPKKPEPPKQVAKAEPKKPAPKKAEPKKEPEGDDFSALLKSVEKLDKRVKAPTARTGRGAGEQPGTLGSQRSGQQTAQISASQLVGMISRQVTPCWRIPIGAQGVGGMRAELNIVMGPDGNVRSVVPLDEGRLASDPVFRAFAESAVRAVRACSPLKLPPESFQQWRNVIFNFDPSMLTG
jgi:outer membrane biosynthesis protein TonB